MQLPLHLRSRISALGELSRPLGEARAARVAEELARDVARDFLENRNPDATINAWIRRIASEILEKRPSEPKKREQPPRVRRIGEVLPEIPA